MSAPPKVTKEQIDRELTSWQGDVSQVSCVLGIHKNSVYKRIHSFGLDLDSYRKGDKGDTEVPPLPTMPTLSPMNMGARSRHSRIAANAHGNFQPPLQHDFGRRRLGRVQGMAQKDDAAEQFTTPLRAVPVRPRQLKVRADLQKQLHDIKLDAARRGIETDETSILNQFIEEACQWWYAQKRSAESSSEPPPEATTKRKRP